MTRRATLGWMLAAALALGLALAAGLRLARPAAVAVVAAAPGRIAEQVAGPGTVQARVPVTLSARVTATLQELRADVGDTVRRGQVLAVLDDRDLAARRGVVGGQQAAAARNVEAAAAALAKARAELALARSRQARDAELQRTGFVAAAVLDASDAAVEAAVAAVDSARAGHAARAGEAQALAHEARYADAVLGHARIAAPMDGVVVARLAEPGTTVVPGTPLLRLVDPATLWVAVRVDESAVGRVQPGQPARIRLRTGEVLAGRVARIARESNAATRELDVHVAFDAPPARFAIDQQADVSIAVGEASGVAVPLAALVRDAGGRPGVLVVADGRAAFRPVGLGAADAERVVVRTGLAEGERVVARGEGVRPGARVRAQDGATAADGPPGAPARAADTAASPAAAGEAWTSR